MSLSHKPSALGQRPALGDFFGYFKVLSQPDQAETADLSHSLASRGIRATAHIGRFFDQASGVVDLRTHRVRV
jgi:hypothetical protein